MKMKSKLLFVPVLLVIIVSALGVTDPPESMTDIPTVTPATESRATEWTTGATEWTRGATEWTTGATEWTTGATDWTTGATEWTTAFPGQNLRGKMFTLSVNGEGRIFLSPPFLSPPISNNRYPTSTYPPWTTWSPAIGVSVCLRYITDSLGTKSSSIFTLSPSSDNPLQLGVSYGTTYWVSSDRYSFRNLYLEPSIRISLNMNPEIWTRVCLTVDSWRNVAQVFSGANMSIRKFLPNPYMWSGEEVIMFSGFDGQVTDVQVWDYPLSYSEVYNYMTGGFYRPYRGSVLSWSHIIYSTRGKVLLEDAYEWQGKQLISRRGRGRQLKGKKKTRRFFNEGQSNEIVRQLI